MGRPCDPQAPRSALELAVAVIGYKTRVAIAQAFGLSRSWTVTSAACHDGAVVGWRGGAIRLASTICPPIAK